MKQSQITEYLKDNFPENLASPIDLGKIGLQFGSNSKEINKIMIALDATDLVIDEAINKGCDLLITHHPFLFYPILSIDYDSKFGKKICKIINNKLNIYSMHTNFDTACGGMNDILANRLNLKDIHSLHDPIDEGCLIRVGTIDEIKLNDFVKKVGIQLGEKGLRYIGSENKIISKVGIVGGAGATEINKAMMLGCDCLVTGEVHHHQALNAIEEDFAIIEVSHYVESIFKKPLQRLLQNQFPNLEIIVAESEKNPFTYFKVE